MAFDRLDLEGAFKKLVEDETNKRFEGMPQPEAVINAATPEQKENLIVSIKQWSKLTDDALDESANQLETLCEIVISLRAENAQLIKDLANRQKRVETLEERRFELLARAQKAEAALEQHQHITVSDCSHSYQVLNTKPPYLLRCSMCGDERKEMALPRQA